MKNKLLYTFGTIFFIFGLYGVIVAFAAATTLQFSLELGGGVCSFVSCVLLFTYVGYSNDIGNRLREKCIERIGNDYIGKILIITNKGESDCPSRKYTLQVYAQSATCRGYTDFIMSKFDDSCILRRYDHDNWILFSRITEKRGRLVLGSASDDARPCLGMDSIVGAGTYVMVWSNYKCPEEIATKSTIACPEIMCDKNVTKEIRVCSALLDSVNDPISCVLLRKKVGKNDKVTNTALLEGADVYYGTKCTVVDGSPNWS